MNIKKLIFKKSRLGGLIMAAAMISVAGTQAKAEDVFAQLNDMQHVESTYVSGRFAHNKKTWRSSYGSKAMDLSRGFSALYTYQCYSIDAVKKAREILRKYVENNKNIELVMRSKQEGQEYMVYEKFVGDDMISQMVIWNCEGPNVCEVVVVDWDGGLKVTKNPYGSGENDSSEIINDFDEMQLSGSLGRLADLEKLGELSSLRELGELGVVLGTRLGSELGEFFRKYDWEGVFNQVD